MNENQKLEDKKTEKTEEDKELELKSLKKAGNIANEVKKYLKPEIKIGASVLSLIEAAESKIVELNGNWAFPVNISINNTAAHYTSPIKDDGLNINEGDIVKVDLGVHIEGFIVDTAFSVSFSDNPLLENIIQATEVACEAAKNMAKPGVNTRVIGKKVASIIIIRSSFSCLFPTLSTRHLRKTVWATISLFK